MSDVPFILKAAIVFLGTMAASSSIRAQEEGYLTGPELRALVSDNTITGRYDNGDPYSEYHSPDGRILGHNNRVPVEEGCWDIRTDSVCYYYAKGRAKGEFCWRFQKLAGPGIRAILISPGHREIIGIKQVGNPHDHSDNGKPWTCDPVTSDLKTPRGATARFTSR